MARVADAVNVLSSFLADEEIDGVEGVNRFFRSLPNVDSEEGTLCSQPTDAIVFCASSVLSLADTVFSSFASGMSADAEHSTRSIDLHGRNTVLVLCGGIGHSTPFLYEAVAKHPIYKSIACRVQGQPEARVLQMITEQWFGIRVLDVGSAGATIQPNDRNRLLVVVEDRSTNCGANASESRRVLEACGVSSPRSIIVVQDPTMSRRTVATFKKTYSDTPRGRPRVISWPTFTPRVGVKTERAGTEQNDALAQLEYLHVGPERSRAGPDGLWSMTRFVDLLMGEVPRLRDNADGYGPNGKGFLVHVDVTEQVEDSWRFLDKLLGKQGRDR